jgi:hypothetical protein
MVDPQYDIQDDRYNHALVLAHLDVLLSSDTPRVIGQGIRHFNVLRWRGHFFALDRALGPVDLRVLTDSALQGLVERGGCIMGKSLPELEGGLAPGGPGALTASPASLVPGVGRPEVIRADLCAAIEDYCDHRETVRCLQYLIRGFDDASLRGLVLELKDVTSYDAFIQTLARIQCAQVRNRLDPRRQTVAIYFPSCAYRGQTGSLATALERRGFNVITLVGTVCDDAYEKRPNVYYGGHNIISQMDFLDVVLCSTLTYGLPERARRVLFVHDIHDSPIGDPREFISLLGEFDYCFLPSEAVIRLFSRLLQGSPTTGERKKGICLIPGGYPKLDRMIEYCEANGEPTQTLIYAPTVTGLEFEAVASVSSHGLEIIGQLLANFPHFRIVFRPHPMSRNDEAVRRIQEAYGSNPRFMYDSEASDTRRSYSRAALMVSDLSGTAYTYALSTLRPVVFYSQKEEEVRRRYGELRYVQDREKVGAIARNDRELVDAVGVLVGQLSEWRERIRAYRDALIYNVGSSEQYFVESMQEICARRRRPEWVCI